MSLVKCRSVQLALPKSAILTVMRSRVLGSYGALGGKVLGSPASGAGRCTSGSGEGAAAGVLLVEVGALSGSAEVGREALAAGEEEEASSDMWVELEMSW